MSFTCFGHVLMPYINMAAVSLSLLQCARNCISLFISECCDHVIVWNLLVIHIKMPVAILILHMSIRTQYIRPKFSLLKFLRFRNLFTCNFPLLSQIVPIKSGKIRNITWEADAAGNLYDYSDCLCVWLLGFSTEDQSVLSAQSLLL